MTNICKILAVLFGLNLANGTPAQQVSLTASKSAINLTARSLMGVPITLPAKWTVLYFWSNGCPCVQDCQRLSLSPLSKQYQSRVSFYALASNEIDLTADAIRLRAQVKAQQLPYPVLLDAKHHLADKLHARITPETFLFDPQGRIVFQGVPDDSWEVKQRTGKSGATQFYLADALKQALAGKKVMRARVKALGCSIER